MGHGHPSLTDHSTRRATSLLGLPRQLGGQRTGQPFLHGLFRPHHLLTQPQGWRKAASTHQLLERAVADAQPWVFTAVHWRLSERQSRHSAPENASTINLIRRACLSAHLSAQRSSERFDQLRFGSRKRSILLAFGRCGFLSFRPLVCLLIRRSLVRVQVGEPPNTHSKAFLRRPLLFLPLSSLSNPCVQRAFN